MAVTLWASSGALFTLFPYTFCSLLLVVFPPVPGRKSTLALRLSSIVLDGCRIHQFEKVEQFYVTSPDNNASWLAFEEMLDNAEKFYQELELPYQVSTFAPHHTPQCHLVDKSAQYSTYFSCNVLHQPAVQDLIVMRCPTGGQHCQR